MILLTARNIYRRLASSVELGNVDEIGNRVRGETPIYCKQKAKSAENSFPRPSMSILFPQGLWKQSPARTFTADGSNGWFTVYSHLLVRGFAKGISVLALGRRADWRRTRGGGARAPCSWTWRGQRPGGRLRRGSGGNLSPGRSGGSRPLNPGQGRGGGSGWNEVWDARARGSGHGPCGGVKELLRRACPEAGRMTGCSGT